jgi:hypothetical protein
VLVDYMTNTAGIAYSGFPERLFVVLDGVVMYEGECGPYGYDLDAAKKVLVKAIDAGKKGK